MRSSRDRLLNALRTMPDEAFTWLLVQLAASSDTGRRGSGVWPDALGGFTPESRAAILETRDAAAALVIDGVGQL